MTAAERDPREVRRVPRESYTEPPRCGEYGCNQERSQTAHFPTCGQYQGKVRFDDQAEPAPPVMAAAPVQVQSQELPPQSQESTPAITPEVMPPAAAPAPDQAGLIDVNIQAPKGTNLRLNISLG